MRFLLGLFFIFTISLSASGKYKNKSFTSSDNFSNKSFFIENFSGSSFKKVHFDNSNVRYCDFFYAKFNKTSFYRTNLSYSEFRFSKCIKTNFEESILVRSWLWNGDFRGADFTNANLKRAIVFSWKIGFEGDDKTIVTGANFEKAWGLTNEQKAYLRENGAINVPEDCDEEEEKREFKVWLDKIQEELFILYPLNKWSKSYFGFVKRLLLLPFRSCLKN